MTEDDYIMISAAAALSIIINRRRRRRLQHNRQCWSREWLQRWNTERGMANFVNQELSEDFIMPICLTRRREKDVIRRVVIIRRFYWLIGGPHLHSQVDSRPDSWMNVLTMQLLVRLVGWIWHVWFVRPVRPTGRPTVHTTQLLDRPVGPTVGSCKHRIIELHDPIISWPLKSDPG